MQSLDQFVHECLLVLPLATKTVENYRGAYRRYVQPTLGHKPLDDISRQDIAQCLAPLTPPSAYQTLMMLKRIFREAVEQGGIPSAPTDRVRTKRVQTPIHPFLTWEEISNTSFGRYTNQVKFLALHGLRWGEAAALTEQDIRNGRVFVTRSIRGATKSAAGNRSVPYLGHFEPFSHDRRGLAHALAPHGVTIHSLRKTYAYILKTSGVHVSTAQRLLGHSSPMLTLTVYTQVLDDEIDASGRLIRAQTTDAHSLNFTAIPLPDGHVHSRLLLSNE